MEILIRTMISIFEYNMFFHPLEMHTPLTFMYLFYIEK